MSDENLNNIEGKLDVLINLTAKQIVGEMSNSEAAPLLRKMGIHPNQIAEILGSTYSAVNKYISEAKKKEGKKK